MVETTIENVRGELVARDVVDIGQVKSLQTGVYPSSDENIKVTIENYDITSRDVEKIRDFGFEVSIGEDELILTADEEELDWQHVEDSFIGAVHYAEDGQVGNLVKEIYPKGESHDSRFTTHTKDELYFIKENGIRLAKDFGRGLREKGYYIVADDSVRIDGESYSLYVVEQIEE